MIKLQMLLVSKLHVPGLELLHCFIAVVFVCKKALISQGQVMLLNYQLSCVLIVEFSSLLASVIKL